ncbi:hypothetical protein Tco_0024614 [Tanacetum coccineum]
MSNRKSSSISPTLGYLPRFLKENCCLRSNLPAEGQSSNALARCSWWGSMETLDFLWPQLLFLNGLIDPLYNVYCKTTTAKELWESLERKYKTEDAGTKKFVVARFLDYKMVDSKNVISQVQDLQRKRWGVLRLGSSSFVLERDNKLGLRKDADGVKSTSGKIIGIDVGHDLRCCLTLCAMISEGLTLERFGQMDRSCIWATLQLLIIKAWKEGCLFLEDGQYGGKELKLG